jgi:signal peptidase I
MTRIGAAGLAVAGLLTGILVLRRRYVAVRVIGNSMEPTLRPGQQVLVRRTGAAGLRRGDLVVLPFPPDLPQRDDNPPWLIKRVIALPGDPVPFDRVPGLRRSGDRFVPPQRLVLLGDNPAGSLDSRRVGYFRADRLLGVVVRSRPEESGAQSFSGWR